MTVLFWDIDGTLLTTGKAGVPAWEEAVREATGRDFQLSSIRVPGMTDYQIAVKTFEMLDVAADETTLRGMVRRYEELLPSTLPLKQGRVLPNVREILETLRSRPDVRSFLLTGNTRGGARAKLTHYDLFDYFPDGAFAEDARERATIAARALEMARRDGPLSEADVIVIGDTPHDIHCADAIGARTIAVATGGYTLDELEQHRPWRLFAELPPPEAFLTLIAGPASRPRTRRRPLPRRRPNRDEARHPQVPGALARLTPRAALVYYARAGAYPDWRPIVAATPDLWASARAAAHGGPRVLLASAIGSYAHAVTLESALAAALTFRGAEVHALLCDGMMTACAECEASLYPDIGAFVARGPSADLCRDCQWPAERVYAQLGITVHRYSDYLAAEERAQAQAIAQSLPSAELGRYTLDGLAVGEHAYAGALRFFATGSLADEPHGEAVHRRYLESAIRTAYATRRLLRTTTFASAVFTHGIYVPWGIVGEVARQERVRVSTWNVAYRKRRFIFSHDDTYHHTLMTEPQEHWDTGPLGEAHERELMDYLASRREGLFDWIVFHRPTRQKPNDIAKQAGVDLTRPVIGLLTNVSWDAQLHYPANAFPNMLEWLVQTCAYFAARPDLQLLIRVHPAEISGFPPSRQPILGELAKRIPQLAPNIIVVPPDSGMSTYALMSLCNAAIIYGTKMGVELTSVGLPVIVAGEAWIRNKGLTHDASTAADYFRILERLPFAGRLGPAQLTRARRYAYHFFFNRMIPLPFIAPKAGYPIYRLKLDRLDELLPGRSPGLDTICEGILGRGPFVLREKGARSPELVSS